MKAVFVANYGGPEVLEVRDVERPQPKENELLIKVNTSCLSRASAMMRSGTPFFVRLFLGLRRPKHPIPGSSFAGVVAATGMHVKGYEIGDAVFGATAASFGTNAEYVCVPANGVVMPMPDLLSFEEATIMCDGPVTSYNFLKNVANILPGQKVLINGASGSLGVAAIQIAKHMGAEVTGVCSTANVELVRSIGADHVIDYTTEDFTQGNNKYDVIYDTIGKSCIGKVKDILTDKGVYMSPVLSFKLLIQMMLNPFRGGKKAKFDATGLRSVAEVKKMIEEMKVIMGSGTYNSVIERRYTMDEVVEAHRYIDTGRKRGNIVLSVASS